MGFFLDIFLPKSSKFKKQQILKEKKQSTLELSNLSKYIYNVEDDSSSKEKESKQKKTILSNKPQLSSLASKFLSEGRRDLVSSKNRRKEDKKNSHTNYTNEEEELLLKIHTLLNHLQDESPSSFSSLIKQLRSAKLFVKNQNILLAKQIYKKVLTRTPKKILEKIQEPPYPQEKFEGEKTEKSTSNQGNPKLDFSDLLSLDRLPKEEISDLLSLESLPKEESLHKKESLPKKEISQEKESLPKKETSIPKKIKNKESLKSKKLLEEADKNEIKDLKNQIKDLTRRLSSTSTDQQKINNDLSTEKKESNELLEEEMSNIPQIPLAPQSQSSQTVPTAPQEFKGSFELTPPEPKDSPSFSLTYNFSNLPNDYHLSKNNSVFGYTFYKYKDMLKNAEKLTDKKEMAKAMNYYKTIAQQDIPIEMKLMVEKNIKDISEYMSKMLFNE